MKHETCEVLDECHAPKLNVSLLYDLKQVKELLFVLLASEWRKIVLSDQNCDIFNHISPHSMWNITLMQLRQYN